MRLIDLFEAISIDQAKPFVKDWDRSRHDYLFDTLAKKPEFEQSRNGYRLYYSMGEQEQEVESDIKREIESDLRINGYEILDYRAGTVKDSQGRTMKLGKVLNRIEPELLQKFQNDPARKMAKSADRMIVLSRHPYDIAGATEGRGWTSCMALSQKNSNGHIYGERYIPIAIDQGSIIAYETSSNDTNLQSPSGRVFIHAYVNEDDSDDYLMVPSNKYYGTTSMEFEAIIGRIIEEMNQILGPKPNLYCIPASELEGDKYKIHGGEDLFIEKMKQQDPEDVVDYAIDNKERLPEELEEYIATDALASHIYASEVIKGRFHEGEDSIKQKPRIAVAYARGIIGGPWPEAEPYIAKDSQQSINYIYQVTGEPFPEAEPYIAEYPQTAFKYARNVLNGPFPEGEPAIAREGYTAFKYAIEILNAPFPEGEDAILDDNFLRDEYMDFVRDYENRNQQ